MANPTTPNKTPWWPLFTLLIAILLLTWFSPEERTLGAGIKPVYVHVSLTWTGMLSLTLTALIGLSVLITAREKLEPWFKIFFIIGLGAYWAGFLVSMVASYVNWGGVPLREPRFLSTMNVLVIGSVAYGLHLLFSSIRLRGLLGMIPITFMIWSVESSRMVLHPDNPVSTAPASIKYTFLGMFALVLLTTGWFIYFLQSRQTT